MRINKFFLRLLKMLRDYIFSLEVHNIYLYRGDEHVAPLKIHLKPKKNIEIVLIDQSSEYISEYFRNQAVSFLKRGDIGYGIQIDGKVVAYAWGREGPIIEYVGRESIHIPNGIFFYHDVHVEKKYRGQEFGGWCIAHLVKQIANGIVIGFCDLKNYASRKMHKKLGAIPIGKVISIHLCGFRIKKIFSELDGFLFGQEREQRSFIAQLIDFPFERIKQLNDEQNNKLTIGIIGSETWQLLSSLYLTKKALPVYAHLKHFIAFPAKIPCLIFPGTFSSRVRVFFDYINLQSWPNVPEIDSLILVEAFFNLVTKGYIEYANWNFPYWVKFEDLEALQLPQSCAIATQKTWVLELGVEYSEIYSTRFDKETRRELRIAKNSGIRINDTPDVSQIKQYIDMWSCEYESRNWSGAKLSFQFIESLKSVFPNQVRIVLAELNDQVVGGGIFFDDGKGEFYYAGAIDRKYKKFFPMYAVIAHEIEWLCDNKKAYINMGGVGTNSALPKFKEHWGAIPVPTARITFDDRQGQRVPRNLLTKWNNIFLRLYFRGQLLTMKKF